MLAAPAAVIIYQPLNEHTASTPLALPAIHLTNAARLYRLRGRLDLFREIMHTPCYRKYRYLYTTHAVCSRTLLIADNEAVADRDPDCSRFFFWGGPWFPYNYGFFFISNSLTRSKGAAMKG